MKKDYYFEKKKRSQDFEDFVKILSPVFPQ
jgi:hypothetical protein